MLCYRHRVRRRMRAVENAGELGDAANASSEIASALSSSEARVFLLGSTVRFLQIAEQSDRILAIIQETYSFDSGRRSR